MGILCVAEGRAEGSATMDAVGEEDAVEEIR